MKAMYALAFGVLAAGSTAAAQTGPAARLPGVQAFTISGTCNRLVTPKGDQTPACDTALVNLAFTSGKSSFIATIRDEGSVSFFGRDSAAKGDIATIKLTTVILGGEDLKTKSVELSAKGECTYTNPNKGPIHVDCAADTARGRYELSFVSDGVWPPK